MGVINVLDKHVAELIAAGEVVERPASVIKELVENSIDAGAKNITVEIKNGGTSFMRVSDDGCGIRSDDVKVAFLRHATSKVRQEADLDSISTLGFRGEALASISAVSRLQLITRSRDEETGTVYYIEGGEEISFEEAGCPVGTTFVIRDLFYNIPARAKFLKKDVAEGNAVGNIIDKTALSHPEIAFTFIRDGKPSLKTSGDGKLMSAVYSVFGREFASGLIPVEYQLNAIKVYGYVCKPVNSRPNRNMQNFFINGRYVKSRTAIAAVEEAFKGSIMVGKFPSCVLNIDLPYELIDVNVHPSKIEVRFVNERPVFDAVYHAVKSALMKHDTRKQASFKNKSAFNDIKKPNPFENAAAFFKAAQQNPNNIKTAENHNEKQREERQEEKAKTSYNPFDELDFIDGSENAPDKSENGGALDSLTLSDSQQLSNNISYELSDRDKAPIPPEPVRNTQYVQQAFNLPPQEDEKPTLTKADEPQLVLPREHDALKYVGELFKTYIIAEKNGKELLLIDKHAAHERILYEKLKSEKAGSSAQLLLQPVTVTLGKEEYTAAVTHLDMFSECSFEVEDFGDGTVIVRSAPQYLDISEISDCVAEMAGYIALGKNDIYTEKMEWFYANVACRSAIKAGNNNTPAELEDILRQLEQNTQIKYCPHGRPVCISMTKAEIEKQFGRT